jgi:hypothetical protein
VQRNELKQKLRKLKKLELKLHYGIPIDVVIVNTSLGNTDGLPLVWNEFFNLHESVNNKARYSINLLEKMNNDELKQILNEFWFHLYYCIYKEKGITMLDLQEPELLTFLDLPYDADKNLIKKRFRELSKTYHPDEGGDKDKFIELMDMMDRYDVK